MCPVSDERVDERVADDGGRRVVVAVVGVHGGGVGDTAQGRAERVVASAAVIPGRRAPACWSSSKPARSSAPLRSTWLGSGPDVGYIAG